MGVKLVSASGGSVEINPPATASSFTATMPAGTGTVAVQGASTNIVSGTSQASTSGTSIDFTGIPSWVRRVTVMFNGVSTNGSSAIIVQLGDSGGVETTGYNSTAQNANNAGTDYSTGFPINNGSAASFAYSGLLTIALLGTNGWVFNSMMRAAGFVLFGAGQKSTSDTLDRVRITTVNGTDTFDAGTINILYE